MRSLPFVISRMTRLKRMPRFNHVNAVGNLDIKKFKETMV